MLYGNERDNQEFSEWKNYNIFSAGKRRQKVARSYLWRCACSAVYCTRAACQIILSTTTLSKDAKGEALKFSSHGYPNLLDKNHPGEDTMSSPGRPFY